jgi:hypothetical protein
MASGGDTAILRTISLTERRTLVRSVPKIDALEVAERLRSVIDIAPTTRKGVYRLTARGYAGWVTTRSIRWVIEPKFRWADLSRMMTDDVLPRANADSQLPTQYVNLMAARLAHLMRDCASHGLHADYQEAALQSDQVRGRIDFAKLTRQPPNTAVPIIADEFTTANRYNLIPAATARQLLRRADLSPRMRAELTDVLSWYPASEFSPQQHDWDHWHFDDRTEPYRRLLRWCHLVWSATRTEVGTDCLINLEHLFQYYVGSLIDSPRVQAHSPISWSHVRGPYACAELRPDFRTPTAVWDAKWKSLTAAGPDPSDIHQVLAYAALWGVQTAGLIYPGRAWALGEFRAASGVRLLIVRLRMAGDAERVIRSNQRFRRLVVGHDDHADF